MCACMAGWDSRRAKCASRKAALFTFWYPQNMYRFLSKNLGPPIHDVPSSPLEVCFFHFRVPQDFFQICIKKFWSTPRFFKKIIFEEKNWVTPRFLSNFIFFQIFVKKLDFSKKYSGGIPKFFDKNLKFFLGQPNFIFRKIKIFDKNLKKIPIYLTKI